MSNNSSLGMNRQRGFSLLEGLISMVLVSLISLGMLYGLAKMMRQQGAASAQSTTINDVRGKLQQTGITGNCSSTGTSGSETVNLTDKVTTSVSRSCVYKSVSMTVTGTSTYTKSIVHPSVTYTAYDSRLSSASLLFTN